MTATNLFHIGILVPDIEEATRMFSRVLGLDFKEPAIAHVDNFRQGDTREVLDLLISWSVQGPPYLELLQSQDNEGIYHRSQEGMHHIGLWEPDPATIVERLALAGLRTEATQIAPDDRIIATYTPPDQLFGTRLELIDEGRRPGMEAWLAGEEWAD